VFLGHANPLLGAVKAVFDARLPHHEPVADAMHRPLSA
jgi:hypothetical protein